MLTQSTMRSVGSVMPAMFGSVARNNRANRGGNASWAGLDVGRACCVPVLGATPGTRVPPYLSLTGSCYRFVSTPTVFAALAQPETCRCPFRMQRQRTTWIERRGIKQN